MISLKAYSNARFTYAGDSAKVSHVEIGAPSRQRMLLGNLYDETPLLPCPVAAPGFENIGCADSAQKVLDQVDLHRKQPILPLIE